MAIDGAFAARSLPLSARSRALALVFVDPARVVGLTRVSHVDRPPAYAQRSVSHLARAVSSGLPFLFCGRSRRPGRARNRGRCSMALVHRGAAVFRALGLGGCLCATLGTGSRTCVAFAGSRRSPAAFRRLRSPGRAFGGLGLVTQSPAALGCLAVAPRALDGALRLPHSLARETLALVRSLARAYRAALLDVAAATTWGLQAPCTCATIKSGV